MKTETPQGQELFPKLKLVLGFTPGCIWCEKFKLNVLPMIKAMGLNHQVITLQEHLDAYEAEEYGYPFIAFCDVKGNPLNRHGGYLMISEVIKKMNETYTEFRLDEVKK